MVDEVDNIGKSNFPDPPQKDQRVGVVFLGKHSSEEIAATGQDQLVSFDFLQGIRADQSHISKVGLRSQVSAAMFFSK